MHAQFAKWPIYSLISVIAAVTFIVVSGLGGIIALHLIRFAPPILALLGGSLVLWSTWYPRHKNEQTKPWIAMEQWSWTLIGSAIMMWGFGIWVCVYYIIIGQDSIPSLADLGFFSFSLLFFLGLLLHPYSKRNSGLLLTLIDSLIWMGSIFAIAWYFLLGSLAQTPEETMLAKFLQLYYVIADILLLSYTIFLYLHRKELSYHSRTDQTGFLLMILALCCITYGDFTFNILNNLDIFTELTWSNLAWQLGWPVGMIIIGIVAYLRRFLPLTGSQRLGVSSQLPTLQVGIGLAQLLPCALLVVLLAVLMLNVSSTNQVQVAIRPILLCTTVTVILLVVVRLIVTLRNNAQLSLQQHATAQIVGQLAMESTRLVLGQHAGKIGTFEWDIQTGVITWTAELEALYDMAPGTFGGRFEHWSERLHPDDRSDFVTGMMNAIEARSSSFSEFRIIGPHGNHRWLAARAEIFTDPERKRPCMIGINIDITGRKQLEDEVKRSKEELEAILQNVADGIIVQDVSGTIIFANKVAAHLSGFPSVEALLCSCAQESDWVRHHKVIIKNERGQPLCVEQIPAKRALRGEQSVQAILQYHDTETDYTAWVLVKAQLIFGEEGSAQLAVSVLTDITGRQELEQRKNVFISMASHELKTPVTSLKGWTYMLRRRFTKVEDAEGLQFLTKMDAQLNRLTKLVSDLLDISRMQIGQLAYRIEACDTDSLIHETVATLQGTTPSHHISIEGVASTQVMGDKDRLGQVLINLLNNAIKYSPHADKVIVRASRDQEDVVVAVQDFGIGIAEVHQQKIFERFYQIADLEERTYPGLGIGLHLSSEIIKRHGGRIGVVSRKGEGSTFSFTLPLPKNNGAS